MRWAQEFAASKIRLLKRIGAIALVISLFLPMHSCTTSQEGKGASGTASMEVQTQYYWAWTADDAKDPASYLILLAFAWPAIAALLAPWQPRRQPWRIGLLLLEPLLLSGTAWMIYEQGWGIGKPEAGAYVAALGLIVYLICWSIETIQRLPNRPSTGSG